MGQMEGSMKMEIGTPVIVQSDDLNNVFRSKVVDISDEHFFIDYPTHLSVENMQHLLEKKTLTMSYVKQNTVFEFKTNIIKRKSLNVPTLMLSLPNKNEVKRIQRREFVRIETAVDVAVYCPENSFAPFTTVTKDISGGGASIIVPPSISLRNDQQVNLYIIIKSMNSPYHYIQTEANVVLLRNEDNIHTMAVQFLMDDEREQEKIIFYCFDTEREQRIQQMT